MLEFRRSILVVLTTVCLAAACFAQLDTGTITVDVRDATGSAVPGATVALRNENTGITVRTGVTNDQGVFNAALIPSGSYAVHVEMRGFKSHQQSNMYLQVNQQLTIQAALQVGEVSDQVTVTSTAPMVEATSGVLREQSTACGFPNYRSTAETFYSCRYSCLAPLVRDR